MTASLFTASLAGALGLAALASTAAQGAESAPAAPTPAPCTAFNGMEYVCGPVSAEDLVRLPGTPWLIASGLGQPPAPGRVQLIDTANRNWHVAWPIGDTPRIAHDRAQFPECATSPDLKSFTAHGLSLRETGPGRARLLVVNHGGREAIEFFDVDIDEATPRLTWIGCVTMPTDTFVNSVVGLPDGRFLATKFYSISQGMNAIGTGQATGGVLEWAPGKPVAEIPGTQLNGANGIEQAENGKVIYVAEWGKKQVIRFDRRGASLKKTAIALDFSPDNLRWRANGSLIAAGQKLGPPSNGGGGFALEGWTVAAIAPATLAVTPLLTADRTNPLQGVSVGVEVDGSVWVGPFRGDRVGHAPLRGPAASR